LHRNTSVPDTNGIRIADGLEKMQGKDAYYWFLTAYLTSSALESWMMQKMQNFKEKTDCGMLTDKLGYNIPKIIIFSCMLHTN
jgi:hypothetical protein